MLRIRIPKRVRHRVHRHYVSPATQGITVSISGPNSFSLFKVFGLTAATNPAGCAAGSNGTFCTLALSLPACPSAANCETAAITTWDAISGCPSACEISGHTLSSNQGFAFNVTAGAANQINITLDGIPGNVEFVPAASSTLFGNNNSGYSATKCDQSERVSILPVDVDGNYILGPGAPVVTLQSKNTTVATVTAASPGQPNAFLVAHPPSLAGGSVIMAYSATPLAGAGSTSPINGSSTVTYSGGAQICGVFTEYATAGNPTAITAGPDGALWFTECSSNKIGRLTTAGVLTEFSIPTAASGPRGIVAGPDGALWFTENSAMKIGRVTTSGAMHEYATGITSLPFGITVGSDSNLWFTEPDNETVAKITTAGVVSENSVPTANSKPTGITSGPDGALWFTENHASQVGRLTTNLSSVSEIAVGSNAGPFGITTGSDGNLWFTESNSGSIAALSTGGTLVRTVALPTAGSFPLGITNGPDGALWVTEGSGNKIARSSTSGDTEEFAVPTAAAEPEGIVSGGDGALWFTESEPGVNKVGRLQ
jgi:virginiamycin B lyase